MCQTKKESETLTKPLQPNTPQATDLFEIGALKMTLALRMTVC
jgi:hypothetical protein